MKLQNERINPPVNTGRPKRFGVRQNTFIHKHNSCYIAGSYVGWLNNVYKKPNTPELQKDVEGKLVWLFWIPKAPINTETGAKRVSKAVGCNYELFPLFWERFFHWLNAGYMISIPIMTSDGLNADWKAGKTITGWHGRGRGWHVIEMFKHEWEYYLCDTRWDEPNPVRKMAKLRLNDPFYYTKDQDGQDNMCAVLF